MKMLHFCPASLNLGTCASIDFNKRAKNNKIPKNPTSSVTNTPTKEPGNFTGPPAWIFFCLGKPLCAPMFNIVVAYDCEFTGENYILVVYNALHMKSMEFNLIPPFMLRLYGLEFNEYPKFLAKKP